MDILEEIHKTVAKFDPDLIKNEADDPEENKDVSIKDYQEAIDSAVDPEDLNFSMDNLFDDEEDELEVEHFPIPQTDFDEEPIKVGDKVRKLTRKTGIGEVLAIGELIEVEWSPELITLEYPEELVHEDDIEEKDKITSLDTTPPILLDSELHA